MLLQRLLLKERILGAILFEMTMERKVNGKFTPDYLWNEKGIVSFLKVDKGLAEEKKWCSTYERNSKFS